MARAVVCCSGSDADADGRRTASG